MGIVQLVVSAMANLTAIGYNIRVASSNRDIHTLSSPYCQDFISLRLHAEGEGGHSVLGVDLIGIRVCGGFFACKIAQPAISLECIGILKIYCSQKVGDIRILKIITFTKRMT